MRPPAFVLVVLVATHKQTEHSKLTGTHKKYKNYQWQATVNIKLHTTHTKPHYNLYLYPSSLTRCVEQCDRSDTYAILFPITHYTGPPPRLCQLYYHQKRIVLHFKKAKGVHNQTQQRNCKHKLGKADTKPNQNWRAGLQIRTNIEQNRYLLP